VTQPVRPVLVVEDDADCREMLAVLVLSLGYNVVTAANGAEALQLTRTAHPCLILLDLSMPVMGGKEFRARQVADPEISAIPVVIVSAQHSAREDARDLGVQGCIPKPLDFQKVAATVARLCSPSERTRN
jgi:CheY-like chemotaxis protein